MSESLGSNSPPDLLTKWPNASSGTFCASVSSHLVELLVPSFLSRGLCHHKRLCVWWQYRVNDQAYVIVCTTPTCPAYPCVIHVANRTSNDSVFIILYLSYPGRGDSHLEMGLGSNLGQYCWLALNFLATKQLIHFLSLLTCHTMPHRFCFVN